MLKEDLTNNLKTNIMKNLFIILTTVLLSVTTVNAQSTCSPRVILNCDSTLTVIDDVQTLFNGNYPGIAYIEFTAGQGVTAPTNTWITTPAQGIDLTYTTSTSVSPSSAQYAVTVYYYESMTNLVNSGQICNSTTIVNSAWDPINNGYIGVPALLGYQYQYGNTAIQVFSCPTQSSATFLRVKKRGKK